MRHKELGGLREDSDDARNRDGAKRPKIPEHDPHRHVSQDVCQHIGVTSGVNFS